MNFISRIIKSINAMRERLKIERHEAMYGPHFNEECALKAVSKMENEDAISSLSNTLNCDINAVQTALNTINTSVSQIACDTKLASCEVINAITSGNANLASQLANCCCQTQRSIDSVNLNLTQMSADNKLSICQQTNTLQNAITSGFNNLLTDNANKFNVIGAKIDAQTQMINDKFCQLEMREMQNKIDTLRDEKQGYQLSALTQQ
jgi:hypothetical protein